MDLIQDPIDSGTGFESQPTELGIDWEFDSRSNRIRDWIREPTNGIGDRLGIGFESESIWGLDSRVNRIGFENKSNWGLASRANQSNGD